LRVKPGLTGEWQVKGRSIVTDFEEIVGMDLDYQHKWSVGYDLYLIWRTFGVVLRGRGACCGWGMGALLPPPRERSEIYNPNRSVFRAPKERSNQIDPETREGARTKTVAMTIGCSLAGAEANMIPKIRAQ
jgi:hypothetical protein